MHQKKMNIVGMVILFLGTAVLGMVVASIYLRDQVSNSSDFESDQKEVTQQQEDSIPSSLEVYKAGEDFVTYLPLEGEGNIAVRVVIPKEPRYTQGAPVVIEIPTFFTPSDSFGSFTDLSEEGVVYLSYLYPGRTDEREGVSSEGENDYGGPNSAAATNLVLQFALGNVENSEGYLLDELVEMNVLSTNVGLYAFSHPGIMAYKTLGLYAESLTEIDYLVGRENPTIPEINAMELGYWAEDVKVNIPVYNPLYEYSEHYTPTAFTYEIGLVRYDADAEVPYFDINENGSFDQIIDYRFPSFGPSLYGKRYFSVRVLEALKSTEGYTDVTWPDTIATPQEAELVWKERQAIPYFPLLNEELKVMLIFGEEDHVQPTFDKPNVHQAYDGVSAMGLWVRLNPDGSYVHDLLPSKVKGYSDYEAYDEPDDWSYAYEWGHAKTLPGTQIGVAGILEMADRTQFDDWSVDLDEVLVK
jgi:hypothetical protein